MCLLKIWSVTCRVHECYNESLETMLELDIRLQASCYNKMMIFLINFICRFTPKILLETVTLQGHKLGLVIDLTFTNKYYHPDDLTDSGVLYKKIFVEGHIIPSQKVVREYVHFNN